MTVTKQQQLEWLAKHMDGWVNDRPEAYLMSVDEIGFVVGLATTISTVEMIYGRHHTITRQEWQQERDKMQKRDAINDMTPVAIPLSVGKHVDAQELQKVIIQNNSAATITATNAVGSEMTITAQDNSWHEHGEFPPSGTICDIRVAPNDWIDNVEIVHSKTDQGVVVKLMPSTDVETYLSAVSHNLEFRPLRTEREKAIDEMVYEFINHYGDPKGGERYLPIAAKLYDAGYRKEKNK